MIGKRLKRLQDCANYRPLDADSVLTYLSKLGLADQYLGSAPTQWQARECGDGNLNLVFIAQGPGGGVVIKQALPYVRMVGESWPLSLRRNFFEQVALREYALWAPEFVPAVYHADEVMELIAMEYLTPYCVLRSGFLPRVYIQGSANILGYS